MADERLQEATSAIPAFVRLGTAEYIWTTMRSTDAVEVVPLSVVREIVRLAYIPEEALTLTDCEALAAFRAAYSKSDDRMTVSNDHVPADQLRKEGNRMTVIERWRLGGDWREGQEGQPIVVSGPQIREKDFDVVRESKLTGAVSTLAEVERVLLAIDAQYAALKYLPTTAPRAQVLEALTLIDAKREQ